MSRWMFVIDTENYAGNFEREMCAYLTGVVGDCGVGEEMAQLYHKETGDEDSRFGEIIAYVPDEDNGCRRPCAIYPTPGWFNHGHGGHFRDGQEKEALVDYIKVSTAYDREQADHVKNTIIPTLEKGEKYSNWTMAACKREIKDREKDIAETKETKEVPHYPAYLSVVIYFTKRPSNDDIAFLKERAHKFQEAKRKHGRFSSDDKFTVTITGFRLLRETKSVQTFEI